MLEELEIIAKPCGSATCPTLYKDQQGRFFLQGSQLVTSDRQDVTVREDEAVVEIDPSLLDALRAL